MLKSLHTRIERLVGFFLSQTTAGLSFNLNKIKVSSEMFFNVQSLSLLSLFFKCLSVSGPWVLGDRDGT